MWESRRLVWTHLNEHIMASKQVLMDNTQKMKIVKKYLLAEHVLFTEHTTEFDKTKVIANIPNYYK